MKPIISPSAFIAENAVIQGNITIEENVSVWFDASFEVKKPASSFIKTAMFKIFASFIQIKDLIRSLKKV